MVRFFAAALALVLASSPLFAGPISVQFQSTLAVRAGQFQFAPPPGIAIDDQTFDVNAGDRIGVASFGPSPEWFTPVDNTTESSLFEQRTSIFDYTATITDTASGQAATFLFAGVAYADWIVRPDGLLVPGNSGVTVNPTGPTEAVLGGNTYRIAVLPYPLESSNSRLLPKSSVSLGNSPSVGAEISLSVSPASVPEPGTLALAAIGLLPVGLFARKRFGAKRT